MLPCCCGTCRVCCSVAAGSNWMHPVCQQCCICFVGVERAGAHCLHGAANRWPAFSCRCNSLGSAGLRPSACLVLSSWCSGLPLDGSASCRQGLASAALLALLPTVAAVADPDSVHSVPQAACACQLKFQHAVVLACNSVAHLHSHSHFESHMACFFQVSRGVLVATAAIVAGCVLLVSGGSHVSVTYTYKELLHLYGRPAYVSYLSVGGAAVLLTYGAYWMGSKAVM